MSEPLNTYSVKVQYWTDHRYPQWITAPTEEEAIKLWVEQYLFVKKVRTEDGR